MGDPFVDIAHQYLQRAENELLALQAKTEAAEAKVQEYREMFSRALEERRKRESAAQEAKGPQRKATQEQQNRRRDAAADALRAAGGRTLPTDAVFNQVVEAIGVEAAGNERKIYAVLRKNRDLFELAGRGEWRLRRDQAADDGTEETVRYRSPKFRLQVEDDKEAPP